MRQGGFSFWILDFIANFIIMRQVFANVCFIQKLWIRWGRYQLQFLNLPTASSNNAGGAILSLFWQFQALSFLIFVKYSFENVKFVVQAFKLLKLLSKRAWGSSKEILFRYFLLLADGRLFVVVEPCLEDPSMAWHSLPYCGWECC